MDAVMRACGGTRVGIEARGPLGETVSAEYGVTTDGIAVMEAASFCGLQLVPPDRRDPARASSYGLGQAVAAALDTGVRRFLIGLGGSATVDGGAGLAAALGYRLEDAAGLAACTCGRDLSSVARIDASMAHPHLGAARFTALCDVDNPLLGPRGAVPVFAPQKGAMPDDMKQLEEGLGALAAAIASWRGADVADLVSLPSGGAAGGLGLGCVAFLGATLTRGAVFMMQMLGMGERIARADLVVTGEGSFDSQTRSGKVVAAVLEAAARQAKPAVVVSGRWDGSLPEPRPASLEVLTAGDIAGAPGRLSSQELFELGRRIGSRWSGLASFSTG